MITQIFLSKSYPWFRIISVLSFLIQFIWKMCNLTPQMVSGDKKNITKIFLSKSYPEKLAESRLSLGNFWKPVFTGIPEIYQVTTEKGC